MSNRPLIAVPCDVNIMFEKHMFHMVGEKYIDAVNDHVGGVPLLIPSTNEALHPDDILSWADGILFTGALSNVHPSHYGGPDPRDGVLEDQQRDNTALPLMKEAIDAGVPVFCICRGFQELNVAMGGTLYPHLQEIDGRFDHREPEGPVDVMYDFAHPVTVQAGGELETMLGHAGQVQVNSLHGQGIAQLADVLRAEAIAEDGTIEAVSHPSSSGYVFGVQWHPEWQPAKSEVYLALLHSFGDAARAYAANNK